MLFRRAFGLALLTAAPAIAQTRSIEGTVYDSLARKPLAGASVSLVNSSMQDQGFNAMSDSAGHFIVRDVTPGTYLAGFYHPLLDSLGIEPPVRQVTLSSNARTAHVHRRRNGPDAWTSRCRRRRASWTR